MIDITDLQWRLPRKDWSIGQRSFTSKVTIHWNGPRVNYDDVTQLVIDAEYHMRPGWAGTVNGADGLMYHYAVGQSGIIYQCRKFWEMLWHTGDADGNKGSLGVHCILGKGQKPTNAMLESLGQLVLYLTKVSGLAPHAVLGHKEWPEALTACPGPDLMRWIMAYRSDRGQLSFDPGPIKIVTANNANIREMPHRRAKILTKVKTGPLLLSSLELKAEIVNGNPFWFKLADRAGYIHSSAYVL